LTADDLSRGSGAYGVCIPNSAWDGALLEGRCSRRGLMIICRYIVDMTELGSGAFTSNTKPPSPVVTSSLFRRDLARSSVPSTTCRRWIPKIPTPTYADNYELDCKICAKGLVQQSHDSIPGIFLRLNQSA
jgi:hypothetical protein